jgi:hypothetical protein
MSIVRPGRVKYATATKEVAHGAPCEEKGFVGMAIKQVAAPAGTGLGSTLITNVQVGELFVIVTKGEIVITNPSGTFHEGDTVYIKVADNALADAYTTGYVKFGRVKEIAPTRGLATGKMRVDLDAKDSLELA